jgi:hypothetical protein
MSQATTQGAAPPMPAEHGAWVVLTVPLLMMWMAFPPRLVPAVLLVLSVLAAWLAQSTAPAARKGARGARTWLVLELLVFAACGLGLVLGWRLWSLVPLGAAAALFAAVHSWMRGKVIKRRLDRSELGELLGVLGLCLTAPAAYVVSTGRLEAPAAAAFAACAVFFGSGVLFVQMLLKRLRARKHPDASRWQVARNVALYHGVLVVGLLASAALLPARTALLAIAAFVPALGRTLWGLLTVRSSAVPSFKTIGVLESVYAVWFAVMLALALPAGSS